MFGKPKKNEQLEMKLKTLQMNFENNYKDAAQENFREFEQTLGSMEAEGKISEAQAESYKRKLSAYKEKLKNYTHKDQKVTWML